MLDPAAPARGISGDKLRTPSPTARYSLDSRRGRTELFLGCVGHCRTAYTEDNRRLAPRMHLSGIRSPCLYAYANFMLFVQRDISLFPKGRASIILLPNVSAVCTSLDGWILEHARWLMSEPRPRERMQTWGQSSDERG